MPTLTKTNLFKRVAADTKGEAVAPTDSSTEWNQWSEWLEEELQSWAEVTDWMELKDDYTVSAGISGTSIALPVNTKKLAGAVNIAGNFYSEVNYDQFDKQSSSTKAVRLGYDSTNNAPYLEFRPALTSGQSVVVPLVSYPTSMASPASVIPMRNPEYLVKRMKVRVFKYSQNPIFTEIETEADLMLQQILENEHYKHSQFKGGSNTREEEVGFVLGID